MKLQIVEGKIYPESPFDFNKSLNVIDMFIPSEDEYKIDECSLTTAIQIDEQTIAFKIESVGTVEKPVLNYQLFGGEITDDLTDKIIDRIIFFLSLNDELKPFYSQAASDDIFNQVVDEFYGLHQVKFLTPFEAAGWAILSQRISMNVAKKMKENLTHHIGNSIKLDDHEFWAFPSPEQILNLDFDEIVSVVKNKRKSSYLLNTAEAFSTVDEEFLRNGPLDKVKNWLLDIKGIGEWSAHLELIRGLGRMEDSLNKGMLCKCVEKIYGSKTSPELEEILNNYKDFPGYWEYYIRTSCR